MPRVEWVNNRSLFLTALEPESMRSGGQHSWVLSEGPLPDLQTATIFSLYLYMAGWEGIEENRKGSWGEKHGMSLLIKALIPSWRLYFHELITSQRPHLRIPPHCGLGFQHTKTGGGGKGTKIQSIVTTTLAGWLERQMWWWANWDQANEATTLRIDMSCCLDPNLQSNNEKEIYFYLV